MNVLEYPACMVRDENVLRCTKYGFELPIPQSPVTCNVCASPSPPRPDTAVNSPPAVRAPTTTADLLAERYDVGLAKTPREEADRRLAICRDACDHHFRDSLHFDRCTQYRSCPGNAAIAFVKRLTGELEPVKNCPWGTRS